jgi:hypothetical protein
LVALGLAFDQPGCDEPAQFTAGGAGAGSCAALDLAKVEADAGLGHEEREDALPHAGPADGQVDGCYVLKHENARTQL